MSGRQQTWAPGSIAVMDHILQPGEPALTAEAKLVYLALFKHMGSSFTCYPRVTTLAAATGISDRTVQRSLTHLEQLGLIRRQPQYDPEDGRRKSTLYTIMPPWSVIAPAKEPCDTETPPGDTQSPPSDRLADPPVTDSHPPGDCVADKVTHLKVTQDEVTQTSLRLVEDGAQRSSGGKGTQKRRNASESAGYTPEYESFWTVYPRHIKKQATFKCWNKLLKDGIPPERVMAAAENYRDQCKVLRTEERYILHPSTFLGPDRPFEDHAERRTMASARTTGAKHRPSNDGWVLPKEGEAG